MLFHGATLHPAKTLIKSTVLERFDVRLTLMHQERVGRVDLLGSLHRPLPLNRRLQPKAPNSIPGPKSSSLSTDWQLQEFRFCNCSEDSLRWVASLRRKQFSDIGSGAPLQRGGLQIEGPNSLVLSRAAQRMFARSRSNFASSATSR